jgi:hypothetical protein
VAAVPGTVAEAEALWYDLARRPGWVDGFGRVVQVEGPWPDPGAVLTWESPPGGRGRVRERVEAHVAGAGQRLQVEDERIEGTQEVAFAGVPGGVRITWSIDCRLKDRTPVAPLVEALVVRRAMTASLRRSLTRFGRERVADAELG